MQNPVELRALVLKPVREALLVQIMETTTPDARVALQHFYDALTSVITNDEERA